MQEQNPAVFDNLNLSKAYAKLNSVNYPDEDLVINLPNK